MKTNAYKVVVSVKDIATNLTGSMNCINVDAFTAMDADREVQDNIDWKLQEITEIYLVNDSKDENGELVYTLSDGFIEA